MVTMLVCRLCNHEIIQLTKLFSVFCVLKYYSCTLLQALILIFLDISFKNYARHGAIELDFSPIYLAQMCFCKPISITDKLNLNYNLQ